MKKKLTSATIAKAQSLKAQGLTLDEIAKKLKLSHGSAVNAVKSKAKPGPTTPTVKTSTEPLLTMPAEPPTQGELRQWLGEQCRGLKDECDAAKARGDNAAYASLSRLMAASAQQLSRVTPDEKDPEEIPKDWEAIAASAREKMFTQLERIQEAETATPEAILQTIARHEARIVELRKLLKTHETHEGKL